MQIIRKFFPDAIPDNEEVYFAYLKGILESVDELSSLQITKLPDGYHFRLSPSSPSYSSLLLKEILNIHNLFHIHLDISKSIKTSGTISFTIDLENK